MKCGQRSIAFTTVFLLLLFFILYVLFGNVNQNGGKFSFTTIFKTVSVQSFPSGNQANVDEQTTTTTQKPRTTTESQAARLLFQTEYDRIEKNLKNGLGADDVPFHTNILQNDLGDERAAFSVYNPHFDNQANNALQNLVIANQRAKGLLGNHIVHPNNALQMFNALSKDIQSKLNNVNSLSHNPVPKLHVKYDNAAQHVVQKNKELMTNVHGGLPVNANQLIQGHNQGQVHSNQNPVNQAQVQAGAMQVYPNSVQPEAQQVPVGPAHSLTGTNQMPGAQAQIHQHILGDSHGVHPVYSVNDNLHNSMSDNPE